MTTNLPYDLEIAKKITGISDEALLKFYLDAMIDKISAIVGYNVLYSENKHRLSGVNKEYTYTVARPLKSILQVTFNNNDVTNECNILSERKIGLDFYLCQEHEIEVIYMAGFETFPLAIQMFLFNQVKSMNTENENAGLKSYSIETISYSLADKEKSDIEFKSQINNLFGVGL